MCEHPRLNGLFLILLLFSLSLASSCSSSQGRGASQTGSIAVSINVPDMESGVRSKAASLDCEALGVSSIEVHVYDENNELITSGGPWPCNIGEGIVSEVAEGSNRTVIVYLKNGDNTVRYRGQETVTIIAGQTANVTISVSEIEEVNQNPVPSNDHATVSRGGVVTALDSGNTSLLKNDIDPEGQSLSISTTPTSGPSHGTLVLHDNGTFSYTHDGSASTSDSFTYQVSDGHGGTATATVSITVTPPVVNQPPVASNDSATTYRGGTVTVLDSGYTSLLQNDSDPEGQNLNAITTPVSGPGHGTLVLHENGTFSYTHDGSASISASFTYQVSDGHGGSASAVVSITITPQTAPVLSAGIVSPEKGTAGATYAFSVHYYDADGNSPGSIQVIIDGIAYDMKLAPESGTSSNGTYRFQPLSALSPGDHAYFFTCTDSRGSASRFPASGQYGGPSVITANHVPIASDEYATVNRGGIVSSLDSGMLSLLDNDSAPVGYTLSVAVDPVRPPYHGTLTLNEDGTFSYTHDGTDGTTDSFTYRIMDDKGGSDIATVYIKVIPGQNINPRLSNPNVSTSSASSTIVSYYTVHYYDADGNAPATINVLFDGASYPLTLFYGQAADGDYRYITTARRVSPSITFTCTDGHGGQDSAQVPLY